MLEVSAPRRRLLYGLSYDRGLFEQYGRFREDLRAGEDTEFNARFDADHSIAAPSDVRTAHRYPTSFTHLFRDAYRRGRLQAAMAGAISDGPRGRPRSLVVLARTPSTALSVLDCVRCSPGSDRTRLLRALPLAALASAFYAAGAATAPWRPYDGSPAEGGDPAST